MVILNGIDPEVATGLGGVVLGVALNEIIGIFRRRSDSKTRFIESNYVYRQQAYSALYTSLIKFKKYFSSFIVPDGDEFSERSEYEEFAPLSIYEDFRAEYQEVELWLPEDIRIAVEGILQKSMMQCNIGLQIALNRIRQEEEPSGDYFDLSNEVKRSCEEIVADIDRVYEKIIVATGMNQLNDYHSKKISM